jgi:Fe-Mn family superoxide dismutase
MQRRDFLRLTLSAGALATLPWLGFGCGGRSESEAKQLIPPPELPFEPDALEPIISEETVLVHFGKHHAGYVEKANRLVHDQRMEGMSLEQIIRKAHDPDLFEQNALFNNVAQAYNHAFYWNSLKPGGGGPPTGTVMERIEADFGSYEKFREAFEAAAAGRFASGWVWLVYSEGALSVVQTANADTPLTMGLVPLLTIDVWEHAYYLDYQNRRAEYVSACLDSLVNWDFVAANMGDTA